MTITRWAEQLQIGGIVRSAARKRLHVIDVVLSWPLLNERCCAARALPLLKGEQASDVLRCVASRGVALEGAAIPHSRRPCLGMLSSPLSCPFVHFGAVLGAVLTILFSDFLAVLSAIRLPLFGIGGSAFPLLSQALLSMQGVGLSHPCTRFFQMLRSPLSLGRADFFRVPGVVLSRPLAGFFRMVGAPSRDPRAVAFAVFLLVSGHLGKLQYVPSLEAVQFPRGA